MSAICGLVQLKDTPGAAERCRLVQTALEPYGRHAQGLWDGQRVALASRLALLLPEDVHDRQPLMSGDGRFVLVSDVRLDNREDLVRRLDIPPARSQYLADADILLAAYERWQEALLQQLIGEFAFAVWDRQRQSLFLARDHLGRRPLFYHQGKGWFGFSSMPAGLLALPEVPSHPDEDRLRELLLILPDHSDHSYFSGIRRLLPGHSAKLNVDGSFSVQRYWSPSTAERIHFKSDDDYVDAFLERLEEAVQCRLRSSGGIASQISAGFDSSTVTTVAASLLAKRGQGLHAFTSVPDPSGLPVSSDRVLDEGPLAAQVTALFANIQHERVMTNEESIVLLLERMFELFNRPAKNVVNLLWEISIAQRAAAQGATTLLVGELGNFTISYDGWHALNTLLREGRFLTLAQQLSRQLSGHGNRTRLAVLYRMLMPSLPDSLQSALQSVANTLKKTTTCEASINPGMLKDEGLRQYIRRLGHRPNGTWVWHESRTWRQKRLTRHEFAEYGKGTLALCGIELRDPTADIRLVDYCLAIPVEQFSKDGVDRWLLRRALSRYWPAEVIASRTKGKQGADWRSKVEKEQKALWEEVSALDLEPLAQGLLDMDALRKQLHQFSSFDRNLLPRDGFNMLRCIAAGHFVRKTVKHKK